MSVNCNHPTCYDSEYCRRPVKEKKKVKINPRSKKMGKSMKEYNKLKDVFLSEHPACGVCGGIASQVHHKRGRIGKDLLDNEHWLAVCAPCHKWIEEFPEQAKEMGYSESRLNKRA